MFAKRSRRAFRACPTLTTAMLSTSSMKHRIPAYSKWTLTGTTPDGRAVEVWGCDFYSFRNGKVTQKDSYWKIVE
jgi:ketosteroid isomerase-like protein